MRYSLLLPHLNWVASTEGIRDVAQAADELGFASIGVTDTIQYTGSRLSCGSPEPVPGGDRRNHFETFSTLAYVSAITDRVRLMTSVVVVPFRDPILAAKQLATIDVMSHGRLNVGIGVGRPTRVTTDATLNAPEARQAVARQYATLGLPRDRSQMIREYLDVWFAIWGEETPVFHGEFVSFDEMPIFPKPLQKPWPPIWVGGRSSQAIDRLVRYGNVWNPSQPSLEDLRTGIPVILDRFAAAGRTPPTEYSINIFASLGDTRQEALDLARGMVGSHFPTPEDFAARTIVGDLDDVIARVTEYAAVGVTNVELKLVYRTVDEMLAIMRRIAAELMPATATLGQGPTVGAAGDSVA